MRSDESQGAEFNVVRAVDSLLTTTRSATARKNQRY